MTAPYKADVVAAERLLKAAVRRAISEIRADDRSGLTRAQITLYTAGRSAELLLSLSERAR